MRQPKPDPLIPDPREERLALWVQQLLNDLRRRIVVAEAHAEEVRLATHPDESNTLVWCPHDGGDIGLGDSPRIEFRLRDPFGQPVAIRVRIVDNQLALNADDSLSIRPWASNDIRVGMER